MADDRPEPLLRGKTSRWRRRRYLLRTMRQRYQTQSQTPHRCAASTTEHIQTKRSQENDACEQNLEGKILNMVASKILGKMQETFVTAVWGVNKVLPKKEHSGR
jgi:hypothetical protein